MARTVEDILREHLGGLGIQLAIEISLKEKALDEIERLKKLLSKEEENAESVKL